MPHEYAVMKAKAGAILSAAQQAGSEALVLCAFGCGAFGNPPMDVAKIFRDLIVQEFRGGPSSTSASASWKTTIRAVDTIPTAM